MNAVISVARMITFRARAPKNDLVEVKAWSNGMRPEPSFGLLADLVRRRMSGFTITQEKQVHCDCELIGVGAKVGKCGPRVL